MSTFDVTSPTALFTFDFQHTSGGGDLGVSPPIAGVLLKYRGGGAGTDATACGGGVGGVPRRLAGLVRTGRVDTSLPPEISNDGPALHLRSRWDEHAGVRRIAGNSHVGG